MKTTLFLAALTIAVVALSSCQTYSIPVSVFRDQMEAARLQPMRTVTTQGPLGERVRYQTYAIDSVFAVDQKGTPVFLVNSPALEIRFTDSASRKTILYFDRLRYDRDTISGSPSRILLSVQKSIPLRNVRKIEIQNGRKNYRYVK
ncbi:hypothetical protein [Flavisolibacter nicotianae]|uniref:hypothetical protein n=1 Tax=Flavisolibacter nicotianae TaxID=2364882 RepID=UPI000EB37D77|nr:hypothetical protein [Flavisolibacter nicotianae]